MRNAVLALVALALGAAGAAAQSRPWLEKAFPEGTTHEFGSVPRGALLAHRFQMTNIWAVPLQIVQTRTSCGCVTVTPSSLVLQPREKATIDVAMDARRFTGPKSVSIFVQVGPQYVSTAVLQVSANCRADVVFNPSHINFGVVGRGQAPAQLIEVEYAGFLDWRVSDVVKPADAPLDVKLDEWYRQPGRPGKMGYRLQVTLKSDAPAGSSKWELYLKTNDSASPLVPVLVEATVQAPLSVVPATLNFETVKVGDPPAAKRVVVRGSKPFRIVGIDGLGDGIEADLPTATLPVQILTIRCKPEQAGDLKRQLTIKTDLGDDATATVAIEAAVPAP
jgi:hypothetical protein